MFVRYTWDHIKIDDHVNLPSERAMMLPAFLRCMGNWIEGAKYRTVRKNSYNYYLLYTVSGRGNIHYRGQNLSLAPGQLCLLDCMELHEYGSEQNSEWHSIWFHIYGSGVASCFNILNPDNTFQTVDFNDTKAVEDLYKAIIPHLNSAQLSDELEICSLIMDFLFQVLLKFQLQNPQEYESPPAWLAEIEPYIDRMVWSDITIPKIARHFCVPVYEVEQAFQTHLKKTPAEYINERKKLYTPDNASDKDSIVHSHPKYVIDAINYIEENYDQNIRIFNIIQGSFISKPAFIKEFKRYTCMKPMEYLTSVRIKKSMNMLQNTFAPITEIAQSCGYASSSLFTKHFKEWTGITPTQFRNKHLTPSDQNQTV